MTAPEPEPSYTRSHPMAHTLTCEPCRVSVGADSLPPELVELWDAKHGDCTAADG